LEEDEAEPLKGPTEIGLHTANDKRVALSQLVDKLNDRFGTDFRPADQLFFDQVAWAAIDNETLRTAARVNTMENFKPVFDRILETLFIERMEGNEDIFDRLVNDPEFRAIAASELMRNVYDRLHGDNQ
jgi:type I restriction enzyme R subunit